MLCYKLLLLSVCFYYAERKQKDFGGRAFGEMSLDSHYQSELVVLWGANTAATQQLKSAIIVVLCVALSGMVLSTFSTLCPCSDLAGVA